MDAHILCLPESAGSALYGMVDVLAATGTLWRELTGEQPGPPAIRPVLVSRDTRPFTCGNGIPVAPDVAIADVGTPDIVIVPELWLAPDDAVSDRYARVKAWLRRCRDGGSHIYSACSGSVLLAAAGILDGRRATSHWGYERLFETSFPRVRFEPAPTICMADATGRVVTAGGTSSWHDLAIHVIARHASPGEALKIAKVYLMKWHAEGQLPYASLVRKVNHADSVARRAEDWLAEKFRAPDPVAGVIAATGVAERTLKRRFKAATGVSIIAYCQNLRIEAAKRQLEETGTPVDEIAADVGYENPAFFRRLFKRLTGMTPAAYRRMFQPLLLANAPASVD